MIKVHCPVHKNEELFSMYVSKGSSSRPSGWYYCKKCDKPYKPKVTF